jgi:short-subunit dehydrogenase
LKPFGVGVTVVCPMYFHTQILVNSRSYDALRDEIQWTRTEKSKYTADDIAHSALVAMRRKALYAIPGWQARWYWWLRRLSPAGFLDGIARDVARTAKTASSQEPGPSPGSPPAGKDGNPKSAANRVH